MDFNSSGKREETMMMEYDEENNQFDVEFSPVEHPVEPGDEDRPVKCPVPISTSIIHNPKIEEKKKSRACSDITSATPPPVPPSRPVRNVRRRHHSFADGNNNNNNFFTTRVISNDETTTIYRVLQQVHEFEH